MSVPHPERGDSPDAPVPVPVPAPTPVRRQMPWHGQGPVVAVVAVGGAIGASARYGASLLWPERTGGFPWTTFWVNVLGCALMGVLMVLVTEAWAAPRLVRPFLGTGVLGGFTTFSTYAVDVEQLLAGGHAPTALACLVATPSAALTAVWLTSSATRRALVVGREDGHPGRAGERPS